MESRDRLTKVLVGLIVLATVAFAVGAAIEKSQHHSEGASAVAVAGGARILVNSHPALLVAETSTEHAAESGESAPSAPSSGHKKSESQHTEGGGSEKHESEPSKAGGESHAAHAEQSGGESAVHHANEGGGRESAAVHANETHSEKVLGLDPEATGLVVAAVIVSLILALALKSCCSWRSPWRCSCSQRSISARRFTRAKSQTPAL